MSTSGGKKIEKKDKKLKCICCATSASFLNSGKSFRRSIYIYIYI